jgi:hypothetical protein
MENGFFSQKRRFSKKFANNLDLGEIFWKQSPVVGELCSFIFYLQRQNEPSLETRSWWRQVVYNTSDYESTMQYSHGSKN